jgi:hypothetical protein
MDYLGGTVRNRPSLVRIAVVALSVASTTSCSGTKNYEQAYFSKHGSGYLVELKGKRHLLAHDPVSAILGNTSEETYEIEIPRIDGTIDGSEIRVERGSYKYSGSIVISQNRMTVNLARPNTDAKRLDPLSWNGRYRLNPKVPPSSQEIASMRTKLLSSDRGKAIMAARELMGMGRDGRRTVYEAVLSNPGVANNISDWLSGIHIAQREKVERWVEDVPDLERLAQSGDEEIMFIGMGLLTCTDEGRRKLEEIRRKDPSKQAIIDGYLNR